MTRDELLTSIDAAIAALDTQMWTEVEPARVKWCREQIEGLIQQKINSRWDSFNEQTSTLAGAIAQLQQVISSQQQVPLLGQVVSSVSGVLTRLQGALADLSPPGASRALGRGSRAALSTRGSGSNIVRVLCVHGVGDHHSSLQWQGLWHAAIARGINGQAPDLIVDTQFLVYDDLFDVADLDAADVAEALWSLGSSGLVHGLGDLFGGARGISGAPHMLRWTAGMVAQWAANDDLRKAARERLKKRLEAAAGGEIDVVAAHSLGSLIAYDTLRETPSLLSGKFFLSFGSQIGNPFVRGTFGGAIRPLDALQRWFHLYNRHDHAFASALRITAPNFEQVLTRFELAGDPLNHDAIAYLSHGSTADVVWRAVASRSPPEGPRDMRAAGGFSLSRVAFSTEAIKSCRRPGKERRRPRRKALLVGINEYPNPEDRLQGCVNDVFLVSSALQECGFEPEQIRVVLDGRATAAGIRERLDWLLGDAMDGDERFFFYSGHGAQMPQYGAFTEVDHVDECLVPCDFAWSAETAITDDHFFELYSQLSFGCRFVVVLDCCHSGGMERSGAARARGLNPPDDIRHRALRWEPTAAGGVWVPRELDSRGRGRVGEADRAFSGSRGTTHRLGSAMPLRRKKQLQKSGSKADLPYMPLILQACKEDQLAYEYRHGVTSFGAFTYSLAGVLRQQGKSGKGITFKGLKEKAGEVLRERLRFEQDPEIRGPNAVQNAVVPWSPTAKRPAARRQRRT